MSDELEPAPRALTIGASDSGGGAGVQADLKTFAAFGVYGASAITAVAEENTVTVGAVLVMPPELVTAQVDAVLSDIGASSVKTGMLASAATIRDLAASLRAHGVENLVVDPMIVTMSGACLLDEAGVDALKREILPLAACVTPNLREAETLTGRRITCWDDAKVAAARIVETGARAVLIKGGRLGPAANATDLFYDGHAFHDYTSVRIDSRNTHGTGDTLSAAIVAGLAKGMQLADAVSLAKSYVTLAIQHAYPIGHGRGPVHHFFRHWQPSGRRYRTGVRMKT
jgi:hydroxymethylpyrimidine/phosphomethylpyrimidine kinase